MNDESKTKKQLIAEIGELRREVDSLKDCEEQLRQMKDNYQKFTKAFLQNSLPMGLTTLAEGRFVDVSDSFLNMIGRRRDEVIGHTSREIGAITDEQRAAFFTELNSRGRVENLEVQVRTKNGELRNGLFNAVMISLNTDKYLLTVMNDITESKSAEKALRESKALLDQMLASTLDAVFAIDRHGRLLINNQRHQHVIALSGGHPLQFGELLLSSGYPPRERDDWQALLDRALRGEELKVETEWSDIHGRFYVYENNISPLCDMVGSVIGALVVAHDITERKRMEDELSRSRGELDRRVLERTAELGQSEEKYRQLFETMAQGVVYQDQEGKITAANPAAQRILGLSLDQMQGRTSIDPRWKSIHEDGSDFSGDTHPSMVSLKAGKPVKDVVMGVFNPKMNETRWIIINAVPQFRGDEPRPYQVYTTFTDITERKKAEQELRTSEALFRTVFNGANDGILVADSTERKFILANDSTCRMLGFTNEELQELPVSDIHLEEDLPSVINQFEDALNHEFAVIPDLRVKRKDGSTFYTSMSAFPFTINNKKHVAAFFRDVTGEKKANEILKGRFPGTEKS